MKSFRNKSSEQNVSEEADKEEDHAIEEQSPAVEGAEVPTRPGSRSPELSASSSEVPEVPTALNE